MLEIINRGKVSGEDGERVGMEKGRKCRTDLTRLLDVHIQIYPREFHLHVYL